MGNRAEVPAVSLEAKNRVIRQTVEITLTPMRSKLGDTDQAHGIGTRLMREAITLLKTSAEKEGFTVEIEFRQTVC